MQGHRSLDQERMVTVDDDITNRAVDFITRQKNANKPFFVWVNTTHMHSRTHTKPESIGQSGRWQSASTTPWSTMTRTSAQSSKHWTTLASPTTPLLCTRPTMVRHEYLAGRGDHAVPHEKNTNWEGAFRVPPSSAGRARSNQAKCPTILSHTSICCKAANSLICNGALSLAVSTCNMDWSTWWVGSRTQWNVTRETSTWVSIPCIRNCIVLTLGKSERLTSSAPVLPTALFPEPIKTTGNSVSAYTAISIPDQALRSGKRQIPGGQPPGVLFLGFWLVNRAIASIHEFGNAPDRSRVGEQRRVALVGHFNDIHRLAPRTHGCDRFAREQV